MWLVLTTIFILTALFVQHGISKPAIPLINPRKSWELGSNGARDRAFTDMPGLIQAGLRRFRVFRMLTHDGCLVILAPEFAREIRNSSSLSARRYMAEHLHANIKGFEPWRQISAADRIFPDAVRTRLMKPLGNLIKPASDETGRILKHEWTDDTEWHTLQLKPSILTIATRLLARAFWEERLSRNEEWLRIVVSYSTDTFIAADALHRWPRMLRPVLTRVLPSCRNIHKQLQGARDIMGPILKERTTATEKEDDALQWMEASAQGRPYDPVMAQIGLSVISMHSMADMLTQVLYDLCERDELVQALRDEVTSVIQAEGLTVTALNKLRLMDSTLKESQRMKPSLVAVMQRIADEDVALSDGTIIPKDSQTIVASTAKMRDPSVYPDPDTFDPYRFLKLRQTAPDKETYAQATTPSPDHMGWGLGKHACPGRNLVVTEIKIALCHILLKYDFQLRGDARPRPSLFGIVFASDASAKITVRRRKDSYPWLS